MLGDVCDELRNYFIRNVYEGRFVIKGGAIALDGKISDGQYFCVSGSVFNDGVHQYGKETLTDEAFDGEIWAMAVPPAVVALANEIKAYAESDGGKPSAYVSESFAGYSYTKATGTDGAPISWQKVFAKRLNRWRKI
jgi:hypothetical protein